MNNTIYETNLELPLVGRGKVRDTYSLNGNLLMVATDRLSAFDVVFPQPIPYKGLVLNQLSAFWFQKTKDIIDNHFLTLELPEGIPSYLKGRSMIVKKAEPILIESVVRGYITGSAWKEYKEKGEVCGIKLPEGLHNGSRLEEPIFTPAYKAPQGEHDENITEERAKELFGKNVIDFIKKKSLQLYSFARDFVEERGLILADTKFEFGFYDNKIILIDELLTPDSSRYWIKEDYDQGKLTSLDKQFLRDYVVSINWDKKPPAPKLPQDIIEKTSERYLMAFERITGEKLKI